MDSQLLDQLAAETSPLRANKVLRAIEDRFTPAEIHESLPRFDAMQGAARDVCGKSDIIQLMRLSRPQPFRRLDLAPDVAFYSATPGEVGDKSLIIALCGRSHRLMTPWTLFLQMLPAGRFDVVILADRSNDHFFNGIGSYAPDLYALVRRVAGDVQVERYARTYCFGTSTGGFPALRFGLLMRAYRSISVGGQMVWHIHRLKTSGPRALQAFDPLCACSWPDRGHLVCIHAEGARIDYLASLHLQQTIGVSRVPVANSGHHNIIYEIYRAGRLKELYAKLFDFGPHAIRSRVRGRGSSETPGRAAAGGRS